MLTISALPTESAKVSVQQEHCYVKPLAPDFQIQVSELKHKIKFLNEKSKAGGIFLNTLIIGKGRPQINGN